MQRFWVLASLIVGLSAVCTPACSSDSSPASPPPSGDGDAGDVDAGPTGDDGGTTGTDGGKPASKVNVTNETFDVNGTSHDYVLAVPKTYDAGKKYPLVLILHGDGGDGASMRSYHTFDDVSGDAAIVAYPSGQGRTWNLSGPIAQNEDQQFVTQLVAALQKKYSIDRVFAAGYSSGGFLVNFLACRNPGMLRGIVVYEGGAPYADGSEQNPQTYPNGAYKCDPGETGVAALVVQGASDGVVTPDSGDYDAQYWASVNGCADSRSDTQPSPCKKHDNCPADKPVLYCLIPNLGHVVWKQGATTAWSFFQGL